ncbi:MAG TPA: ABC transporter permease, partial [Saprospiraceae bacterium]|nr:ABC transporter permease [Saprospiraceae bacterium]
MKIYFNILIGSITQAFQQLASNKMRSFLSLLGILIGILCIILILSAVDSLQANIEQSFEKLGRDVLYVDRFPWNE